VTVITTGQLERVILAVLVLLETHCYKKLLQLALMEAQPQADLGKQPGTSWFRIQLQTQGWADTGKAQLGQYPCCVCSTAEALQSPEPLNWQNTLQGGVGGTNKKTT